MRKALAAGILSAAVLVMLAACGGGEEEQAVGGDPQGDTIAMGEQLFSEAMFDTIQWEADSVAIERGAVVWSFSCSKCHGPRGWGDGGFVQQGDTIRPPSFVTADFRFADDREEMRRFIFVGGREGMPHWGMAGLKPRDIDAVTLYIERVLRAPNRIMQ